MRAYDTSHPQPAPPADVLEIHVPVGLTPGHLTQLLYFCMSLEANGGLGTRARVVAHVGADRPPCELRGIVPELDRFAIQWRWVDRRIVQRFGMAGTSLQRLRGPFRTPWAVLAEPSILVTGSLADLPLHDGFYASRSPLPHHAGGLGDAAARVAVATGLSAQAVAAVDWLNLGIVVAPVPMLRTLSETIFRDLPIARAVAPAEEEAALALALALARQKLRVQPLPARYNAFLVPEAPDGTTDAAWFDASCLNYGAGGSVRPAEDFASPARVLELCERQDLQGPARLLQGHLNDLHALQAQAHAGQEMPLDRRSKLLRGLRPRTMVGVEIGALDKPLVQRDDGRVTYVDWTDAATLRARFAHDAHVNASKINVDAVWGERTLAQAIGEECKVDYVVASHVVEHVPDLITWLQEIAAVLAPGGQLRLAVPDRRYTFDFLRQCTRVSEVMAAHLLRARQPTVHSILDFCVNFVTVDGKSLWEGTQNPRQLPRRFTYAGALEKARDALEKGNYHDVHCWVFTSRSFAALFEELGRAELMHYICTDFYDTEPYSNEFIVGMRLCDDTEAIVASWRAVKDRLRDDIMAPQAILPAAR